MAAKKTTKKAAAKKVAAKKAVANPTLNFTFAISTCKDPGRNLFKESNSNTKNNDGKRYVKKEHVKTRTREMLYCKYNIPRDYDETAALPLSETQLKLLEVPIEEVWFDDVHCTVADATLKKNTINALSAAIYKDCGNKY